MSGDTPTSPKTPMGGASGSVAMLGGSSSPFVVRGPVWQPGRARSPGGSLRRVSQGPLLHTLRDFQVTSAALPQRFQAALRKRILRASSRACMHGGA